MKVLITGGGGLLGQYLNIELSGHHQILTVYRSNPGNCNSYDSVSADISDWNLLKRIFNSLQPDAVVHTAAISRPELCDELPREVVKKVNIFAVENLAGLCADNNATLLFTSTDLVYNGDTEGMLGEDGLIDPRSVYAESKVLAEEKVVASGCKHLILRTSLLYGLGLNHTTNNFHSTYNNLRNGKEVNLFHDQFRTPLALHDAAEMIRKLSENYSDSMTLNFGGKERVSRLELGERLCQSAGLDKSLINSVSMFDLPTVHKVRDVSMNTSKLNSLGIEQKSVDQSIKEILESGNEFSGSE